MIDVDKRTLAGLVSNGTATYPHGLQKTPDTVIIRFIQTLLTAPNQGNMVALVDATNVTVQNIDLAASPDMEICTLVFHSIMT
jgi:hypothetical protein